MSTITPIPIDRQQLCVNIYGDKTAQIIQNLAETYHWINVGDDGYIELCLDNHMMQSFRSCEAYFVESFLGKYGSTHPVWFLSLGVAVHKMMELYYIHRADADFTLEHWILRYGANIWKSLNMDQFSQVPEYNSLGGLVGFGELLIEYAYHFNHDNERFRVIGTELYFGKGKEVLLNASNEVGIDYTECGRHLFRLYLSGKIDLLMDDGDTICPMDHKTFKNFMGKNPALSYELNDGLTGYVFAARKLLEKFNLSSELKINRKLTNKIWMNYIQITRVGKDKNSSDRFKRAPLYKTDQQLEDYRRRQMRTGQNILSLLLDRASTKENFSPAYNTQMCSNWMHRECPFKQVHRLDTSAHSIILNSNFVTREWKPEEPSEIDLLIKDV